MKNEEENIDENNNICNNNNNKVLPSDSSLEERKDFSIESSDIKEEKPDIL